MTTLMKRKRIRKKSQPKLQKLKEEIEVREEKEIFQEILSLKILKSS